VKKVLSFVLLAVGLALALNMPATKLTETIHPTFPDADHLDTVGGTTYDQQSSGPQPRIEYFDTGEAGYGKGIHVVWAYSGMEGDSNPDLNVRYNFYDMSLSPPAWVFNSGPDSDFMHWGASVFGDRSLLGNLDVNPNTHCAYFSATTDSGPAVARNSSPGRDSFQPSGGPPSYLLPLISLGHTGKTHAAMSGGPGGTDLYYSVVDTWPKWSSPNHIPPPMPDPAFPTYAIASSPKNGNLCITWLDWSCLPHRAYYRKSTDDGVTWLPPEELPLPPAFTPGSDTAVAGIDLIPWYDPDDDEDDALHIVATVAPVIGESLYVSPAEIWHWSETSDWSQIARAGGDPAHLAGSLGEDAIYADRPTVGLDQYTHGMICAWEQFDSTNVEPLTGQLRADIWMAQGDSTGVNWSSPVRVTSPDHTSKRFPCVSNWVSRDTCPVLYEIDQVAGFAVRGHGPWTENPIVVQWVPLSEVSPLTADRRPLTANSQGGAQNALSAERIVVNLRVQPNPCHGYATLSYELRCAADVRLRVFDASGRVVAEQAAGNQEAGEHCWRWKAATARPGVYFCNLEVNGHVLQEKLLVM
jgi:hypothetical protein